MVETKRGLVLAFSPCRYRCFGFDAHSGAAHRYCSAGTVYHRRYLHGGSQDLSFFVPLAASPLRPRASAHSHR
jgi:hypothetical protein